MEIIIVPILAFLFFACIVFALAILLPAFRQVANEHKAKPMSALMRREKLMPAFKKSGILIMVALASIVLLAILTFSTPT